MIVALFVFGLAPQCLRLTVALPFILDLHKRSSAFKVSFTLACNKWLNCLTMFDVNLWLPL